MACHELPRILCAVLRVLTNTNDFPVIAGQVVFPVAALQPGQTFAVQANTACKKKSKPGKAPIVSVQPIAGKSEVEVTAEVTLPPARTTEVRISPGGASH